MKALTLIALGIYVLCVPFVALSFDEEIRRQIRHAEASGDPDAIVHCMFALMRTGQQTELARRLLHADNALLDRLADVEVIDAKRNRPKRRKHLREETLRDYPESAWWYNPKARRLHVGGRFITSGGRHWTKVVAGIKEVWRAPPELARQITGRDDSVVLVGASMGRMTHFDALRVNRALNALYDLTEWPQNPTEFLRQKMAERVNANNLPGGRPRRWDGTDIGDVSRFFEPLMESIGGLLERDVRWNVPVQEGAGNRDPGPTRQFSALYQNEALEVLDETVRHNYWSSSINQLGPPVCAFFFSGHNGHIGERYGRPEGFSVRLIGVRRVHF